ncbi:MAG: GntR family transcriptional regulator [Pseudomonadota bacterium]
MLARTDKKKIEELSLVDRLVDLIRDAIIAGELQPGAHIGIKKLADAYGVSMIPVREALARLLASRLVRVENNRGYFVISRPSADEFRQFVEARELFETSVVGLGFENATKVDIRKLRGLNEKMRKVAKVGRTDRMVAWSRLNARFHEILVGLARNSYLSNQYADLTYGYMHFQLVRSYPEEFPSLQTLIDQHDEIIEALETGDKKRLLLLLSGHIRNVSLGG